MSENGFTMVKCQGCGLLYVRERPDDNSIRDATAIGQHHGDETLDANVRYNAAVYPEYRKVLRQIFKPDFGDIRSWLDVGCGYGEFIDVVRELSSGKIEMFGSEPNVTKQNAAKNRGLKVGYFDLDSHEMRYDMVSLLNVYSHLPDPAQFIGTLKRVIKPGGEFLIQTGDAAKFTASEILKPLCLPDHLSFASEKIVSDILNRNGFEVVSVNKFPDLPINMKKIVKEIVKYILPKYDSYIKYYLNWHKYQDSRMYIRAKLVE
jgi:SAM-dependent methyltransferase